MESSVIHLLKKRNLFSVDDASEGAKRLLFIKGFISV